MAQRQVRVRIAPSPTGYLHIGTARTALFNWLFARQHGGAFILRIEDTDKERSRKEYEEDIFESLRWLGLNWEEGPALKNGEFPISNSQFSNNSREVLYRQSERTEAYKKYLQQLLREGYAYYCFCTKEDLEAERQALAAEGLTPKYSGRCRRNADVPGLSGESPRDSVIRFKMPETVVEFTDEIRGRVKFDMSLVGDVVIAKDFDTPLYNFAATVDDYEMNITHVIRGEDHLANTPKQIVFQKALGFPQPAYAHLPLILSPDRSKMSKRYGDTALREYRAKGYLPQAVVNFLLLLGWHPSDAQELFTLPEAVKAFDIKKVQKSGAVFSEEKLEWFNAHYIRAMPLAELMEAMREFAPAAWQADPVRFERALGAERERMRTLAGFTEQAAFFFEAPAYPAELLLWKGSTREETLRALGETQRIMEAFSEKDTEARVMEFAEARGRGAVLWPLRVALSGAKNSPGPFEIFHVIGKAEALRRVAHALSLLHAQ